MVNPPRKSPRTSDDATSTTRALADRTYRGAQGTAESTMRPITINLPIWMVHQLEETARITSVAAAPIGQSAHSLGSQSSSPGIGRECE
jgi:hypothetical protein